MKITIYDLNECELSPNNGMYGGNAGFKEGIIFQDDYYMVKYPKNTKGMRGELDSYTSSPLSEFIGSHIYEILGNDVHQTILGEKNHKIVVGCKDFCVNGYELREIRTLKNIYNQRLEEMLEIHLSGTDSTHSVNLDEVLIHLDNNPILARVPHIKDRFWDCVIIDGLIKNNDRNNGNWGLLYKDGEYTLAPIYDNGAAFSNKIPDKKIEKIMSDQQTMVNNSLNVVTTFSKNDNILNLKTMLSFDYPDLKKSIVRVVPKIISELPKIEELIVSIPETYHSLPIISPLRKKFYIEGIKLRVNEILIPALENTLTQFYSNSISKLIDENKISNEITEFMKDKTAQNKLISSAVQSLSEDPKQSVDNYEFWSELIEETFGQNIRISSPHIKM